MKNKYCWVISGRSGAGKSSLAKSIQSLNFNEDIRICEADSFFETETGYNFDASKLGQAHNLCKADFFEALENGLSVIVSNTGTTCKERDFYIDAAKEAGYTVFSVAVEGLDHVDVHNVPFATVEKQRNNLKSSFRF